jgi:cytoskeletal protein CcmA (bactofilin family)
MLGKFKVIFGLLFALVFSVVLTKSAFAFETATINNDSGNLLLSSGQAVNDNYFAFGNIVTLDGNVSGDLISAGNQVELNGEFSNNVVAAGSSVVLKGKVNRDLFVVAASVTIDKDAVVEGDFSAFASTIIINGKVNGNVRSGANALTVNGIVGKNIYTSVSNLTINSGALVNGGVTYTSDNQAEIDPNAKISGQVEMKQATKTQTETQSNTAKAGTFILSLLSVLLVGVVLLLIMPKKAEEFADIIKGRFWASFGTGFLVLLLVPMAIILLFAIFIGIPLALILIALYIFAIYVSTVFVGLTLGKLISHEKWSPIWAMTFGVIILSIISCIPYLGGIAGFIIILLGLGSIGLSFFSKK